MKILKKAIKGAYFDYYGENISDECVNRIIRYYANFLKEREKKKSNKPKTQ